MITAWSHPRAPRARTSAGPLLRVLAMAVLLFGVVFTHGVDVESVRGHLVTGAAAPATALPEEVPGGGQQGLPRPAVLAEPSDDHGHAHASERCTSGQPQQGPVLTPPHLAVSVGESAAPARDLARLDIAASALSVPCPAALRQSVVQQV